MGMNYSLIESLKTRLADPLPGLEAQVMLAPSQHRKYLKLQEDHRVACVMLLLFPKENEWNICYIQRTSHNPEDRHAGQISFPGGKFEKSDNSLEQCALRETHEEIGISPERIKVLGQLSELYVYVSKFRVFPFVGVMEDTGSFTLQESEVKSVIEVPISYLDHRDTVKKGQIQVRNFVRDNIPYYDLYGKKLWGATAMITSEFLHLYRDIKVAL